jgi:hypothetical protein
MKDKTLFSALIIAVIALIAMRSEKKSGEALHGIYKYKDFQRSAFCRQCHREIYYQWKQSMMAQAYTHHWDEIEYFNLAVEHGKRNPKFKPVANGCNGCHTPFAFMAGDTPPPKPSKRSMANEAVSCDVCHTISGYDEAVLYNFSYFPSPGRLKYGNRGGKNSPSHDLKKSDAHGVAKFCATCHNEKSPWGVWVKSTYNEWLEGPYAKEGVQCHTCHMPTAPGRRAITEKMHYPDIRQHLFHGAHVQSKISGAIDVLIQPSGDEFEPGEKVVFTVQLFNQKCGHKVPSGSVEDRMLYLQVEAVDSKGKVYHLPVDKKGFEGEEYTIASQAKAYQDFAEMMDVPEGFDGLPRDGIPVGNRIFRMPYFTEKGIMTICQWNTARLGIDYRIAPRETKIETFTWTIPDSIPEGTVRIIATLNYRLLVKPVADFLKVPEEESRDRLINRGETAIDIFY